VNVAARLEGFGKELVASSSAGSSCSIVIGETTFDYLDHQFKAQRVGEVSLKGKDEKVAAYWVVGGEERSGDPIIREKEL
jgi:class 3 adenylate cyclase